MSDPQIKIGGDLKKRGGEQYVSHTCGYCGSKGGAYLVHYELMRCGCGKMFWALRPHRDGPLVLFEWPGMPKTKAEMLKAES